MALEPGGYADKLGNRYEGRWVVKQLLGLLDEKLNSVTVEAVGDDEAGVDLWVVDVFGTRCAQQCKIRNGSSNQWTVADLNRVGVLGYMQKQLSRDAGVTFELVTAISSPLLHDICNSARDSSGDSESFYQHQIVGISKERSKTFTSFCSYLFLDSEKADDRAIAYGYLSRIFVEQWPDTLNSQSDLRATAQWLINGDSDSVLANLSDYAENHLRKTIYAEDVWRFLIEKGFSPRALSYDYRIAPTVHALREQFEESISHFLIAGELIEREETGRALDALEKDGIVVLHGRPGYGKSGVLYEIVQHLEKTGQVYLPLRLDRQEPRNTTQQFGCDLGLQESPVKCLHAISNGRPCTLILDQLDAIRWTYGHSKNALEVCKSLVREIKRLRGSGYPINVILACRTYDLENDPDIKAWLNQTAEPGKKLTSIEIGPLSDETVSLVARKIEAGQPSERQVSILKSPQHLAMWVKLVEDGQNIEFRNRVQLMRAYWDARVQELAKTGLSPEVVDAEVSRVVQYMEAKGRISAPYSINKNAPVINALCACGLIQVATSQITFSHQSYLDYQIANNLVRDIFSGNKGICDWLGDKSSQSLFRREQLRQVLSLLSEESPEDFLSEIQVILANDKVRFNLKHVALEVVGQVESPDTKILKYMLALSEEEFWREHIIGAVFWGHSTYVSGLMDSGVITQWLASEKLKDHGLRLLRSVSDKIPDSVSEQLLAYMDDESWHQPILSCLNWDIDDDSEKMFQVRIQLAQAGVVQDFVAWQKVSAERAIQILEAFLQSCNPEDFSSDKLRHGRTRFEKWSKDDLATLLSASKEQAGEVWDRLFPQVLRLSIGGDDIYGIADLWLDDDRKGLRNERESLPNGIVKLCLEAGRELVRADSCSFWRDTEALRQSDSFVAKNVLVSVYASLDTSLADDVLFWLMTDIPDFVVGTGYLEPRWMPAARLIESLSAHISDDLYQKLEYKTIHCKDDKLRKNAEYWLPGWKEGYYGVYWGYAQYFLLPCLCKSRRSQKADELIAVLNRKFEGYSDQRFVIGGSHRGGFVSSALPQEKLARISDRAWLRIIQNKDIHENHGGSSRNYGENFLKETSVAYFSRDLESIARRFPDRFAQLALKFPDNASSHYKSAIVDVLQETEPKNIPEEELADWKPVDHKLVLSVLEKFSGEDGGNFPLSFCRLISRRAEDDWSGSVIEKLLNYAISHEDPEPKKLHIGNANNDFNSDESSISNLESNAINCVRGVAAIAIGHLLWAHEELLDSVLPTLEYLVQDEHPAVRIASIDVILPIVNLDKGAAVRLFVKAVHGDYRVAGAHAAIRLYNACIASHYDQLYPVIVGMLESPCAEVVERAAQEVTARWLFHDLFLEEIEACISGDENQRKGVAHIAAYFIGEASYFDRCKLLVDRLKNDESKEVRAELSVVRKSELLATPEGVEFLVDFTESLAFADDPTFLLYKLEDFSGDLLPFADLLLSIGSYFIKPGSESDNRGFLSDAHYYTPLTVRLYEQARDAGEGDIESKCLDIWDGMFEKRVGSLHDISKVID